MYKTKGEPFNLGYLWYSFLLYTFLTLLCFFPLLFGATDARRRRHCLCTRFRARNGTAAKNLCLPGLFMHRAYLTYTNADSCIEILQFSVSSKSYTNGAACLKTCCNEFCLLLYMQSRAQLADEEGKNEAVLLKI